jgi:hypothetical protein
MCGTRDAGQNRETEYSGMIADAGSRQGSYSTCVFYHEQKKVGVVAHGDDFNNTSSELESRLVSWSRSTTCGGEVQEQTGEKQAGIGEVTVTDHGSGARGRPKAHRDLDEGHVHR